MSNFSLEESLDALVAATEAFTEEYCDIAEEGLFSKKPKTVEEALNAQKKKISKIKTIEAVDAAIQAIDDAKDNFNAEISKIKDAASAEDADPKAVKAATKEASKAIKKMASKIKYGAPAAKLIESASSDEAAEYVKSYIVGVKQLLEERKRELSGGSDESTEGKCGTEACGKKKCGTEACGKNKKACESSLIASLESMMITDDSVFEAQEAISGSFDEDGDYVVEGFIKNYKAKRDFNNQIKAAIPGKEYGPIRLAASQLRHRVVSAAKQAKQGGKIDLVYVSHTEKSVTLKCVTDSEDIDVKAYLKAGAADLKSEGGWLYKTDISGDTATVTVKSRDNGEVSEAQEMISGSFDEFGDYACEGIIKNFKARREFKAQLKDAGAPGYIKVAASQARSAVRKAGKNAGVKTIDLVFVNFDDDSVTLRAVVPEGTDTGLLGEILSDASDDIKAYKKIDYDTSVSGDTIKVICKDDTEDGAATESYYDSENAPFDILI